jgi:predicted transcriptional regulator
VAKSAFLGIRMNPELRTQLERIAQKEERSMSQICEVLLRGGVVAYQKEGSKYLQRFFSKRKTETEQ